MRFDPNTIPAATESPLGEPGRQEWAIRQEPLSNNWCKAEAQTTDEMFQGCFGEGGGKEEETAHIQATVSFSYHQFWALCKVTIPCL